jgi:hypothetical protein
MENLISRITLIQKFAMESQLKRNMRWRGVILDMLGSGMETNEILDDHPELEGRYFSFTVLCQIIDFRRYPKVS